MSRAVYGSLIVASLAVGLALRLAAPDARPMHHDEANQAVRFGTLLETGYYAYDRTDHHGPTLYYLTLPVAWVWGQRTLASLDERTIRLVPAIFGTGLILLMLPLGGTLGCRAVVACAWLAALSPALTYYSRFYIQETLLAFFALAFLIVAGRYIQRPRACTALLAGLVGGLAYATKETSVVVLPAALIAIVTARAWQQPRPAGIRIRDVALGCSAAVVVAFLLYSSFLSRPADVLESIRAFGVYFDRGLGTNAHRQSWHYYLRLLAFSHSGGLVWTEGLVLVLAAAGIAVAIRGGTGAFWPRAVAVYSIVSALTFAAVPYKTPWNLLPFYVGFVGLAGIGAAAIAWAQQPRVARGVALALLAAGYCHLGVQNWRANFVYPADPRNPYVCAQTLPDFLRLVQRVTDVAALHPDRDAMLVTVLAGPYEQWPLPWYLRRMTRVGYWTRAEEAGTLDDAPLIVASQENALAVEAALGIRYVTEHYGLRPDVILTLHIERGLWERFVAGRTTARVGPG
ncbi:MAG: flippase activity-associated protein Agl23 [Acidobacteriota bacterium]